MSRQSFVTGAVVSLAGRALAAQLLRLKFAGDLKRLNGGDHSTLLKAYANDAVLHFNDGDHRWSGTWTGKPNIDRFLQNFTAAKVQGEIKRFTVSGPLWAMTLMVRFDDHADAPDGTRLYQNRTVLVIRMKWGKIVEHEGFYFDTERIGAFDRKLAERGVLPVPKIMADGAPTGP